MSAERPVPPSPSAGPRAVDPVATAPVRPRISDIIIDCVDPDGVAAFWSELLGRPVEKREGPYVVLARDEAQDLAVSFQRVPEPRSGKNRVHFDVTSDDVAGVARRVLDLGGRRAPGYEAGGFLVMADPEGNEFCIVPTSDIPVDPTGRATYADGLDL